MQTELRRIRFWLTLFIAGLVLSGLTAFPLQAELHVLAGVFPDSEWVQRVRYALDETYSRFPFIAYGTDWLAFAHLAIAVAFFGPWRDPERNEWVITFGLLACLGVVPLALIAGPVRGIPFYWRLIDCSFGVIGVIPLLMARSGVSRLKRLSHSGVHHLVV